MNTPHIFVTGGAQGIGRGIVRRFLDGGYRVSFSDVDAKAGGKTLREFGAPERLRFFKADVAREKDIRSSLKEAVRWGGRLDVLVNNAGFMIRKPLERLSLNEWNKVLSTNLTAMFLHVKVAAPTLRKSGGIVINIASTRALMSEKHTESYSATKGGIVALSHALAISLGPAIRVHCVSPGWINVTGEKLSAKDHAQHPAGRVGMPEDIANLAWFLAQPENRFLTGENIVVDGGMTRKMIYDD